MGTIILYGITILLLIISFVKDKGKTKKSLRKAWKAFENILPQFLGIIVLVGIILGFVDEALISKFIGDESGFLGVLTSAIIGAVTLIPGFVAFPMAGMLVKGGAGYMQIGAFISSLMMVGIVTLPLEINYFGKKTAVARNVLAFFFSFLVAFIIGNVL